MKKHMLQSLFALTAVVAFAVASGTSRATDGPNKVLSVNNKIAKSSITRTGSAVMLNPQPLPPRWQPASRIFLNPIVRVGLNPQPLPPGPPDPVKNLRVNRTVLQVR